MVFVDAVNTGADVLWITGGVLALIAAVAFVWSYFKANVKKNDDGISERTITEYRELVGALETKNKILTTKMTELARKQTASDKKIAQLETMLESFKNYPFEIADHMRKTNDALTNIIGRLDSIDRTTDLLETNKRFDVAGVQGQA